MLQSYKIEVLVDVRSLPWSRKFPHFNKENLEKTLPEIAIEYIHRWDLWGRRKVDKNSHNTRWNNLSFRGYADYMETLEFKDALQDLEDIAHKKNVAYMCSEAVWWRCHRSMISDYLKLKGWKVLHIMGKEKTQEHPYTSPARIVDNKLVYSGEENS